MKMKLIAHTLIVTILGLGQITSFGAGRLSISRDAQSALDGSVVPNPGDKMNWADGVITRKADGSLYYESNKVSYSNTIKSVDDLYTVANHNPNIASYLVDNYGINPSATPASYKNFNDSFWDLTARAHSPNLSLNISPPGFNGDYTLNFDEDGIAKTVTTPDGQKLSIEEFKRTNAYAAMSGSNDVGPLSEMEREFSIASLIWGVKEKGVKDCKPTSKDIPPYMKKWADAIKTYHQDEIDINNLLITRMALMDDLSKKMQEEFSDEYQIEVLKIQLEAINMSIDALSGSSTFTLDKPKTPPKSRIASREKMLEMALSTLLDNEKDKLKFFEAYKVFQDKVVVSYDIAKKGCSRISIVQECATDDAGTETCTDVEKNDPVQGSCEMVEKFLPVLENGPFYDYAKIYFLETVPSFELNSRMLKIEQVMESMYNQFPESGLAEFDWKSPLAQGYKVLKERRLEQGMICANPNPEPGSEEFKKIPLEVQDYSSLVLGQDKGLSLFEKNKLLVNSNFKLNFTFDGLKYDTVKMPDDKAIPTLTAFLGEQKNIDDYKKFYISVFAIKDLPEDKVFESFLKNWYQSDLVLGQSGQRGMYLSYAIKVLEDTIAMDKVKLEELSENKELLEEVIKKVQDQLDQKKLAEQAASKDKSNSNVSTSRGTGNSGVISSAQSVSPIVSSADKLADSMVASNKIGASSGINNSGFMRSNSSLGKKSNQKNLIGRSNNASGDVSSNNRQNARASSLGKEIEKTRRDIASLKGKIVKRNDGLKKLSDSLLSNNNGSFGRGIASATGQLVSAYQPNANENQRIYKTGLNADSKNSRSQAVTGSGKTYSSSSKYRFNGSGSSSSSSRIESSSSSDVYANNTATQEIDGETQYQRLNGFKFDESSYNKNELFDNISKTYQNIGVKRLGFED